MLYLYLGSCNYYMACFFAQIQLTPSVLAVRETMMTMMRVVLVIIRGYWDGVKTT